jgi:hypothetical protein
VLSGCCVTLDTPNAAPTRSQLAVDFISDDVINWPQAVRANSDYSLEDTKTAARQSMQSHFLWALRFEIYDQNGKLLHGEYRDAQRTLS